MRSPTQSHEFFSKVFWFTLEFGVVYESGELRAYGAGLLSSYGEIEAFRDAEIRPFDIAAMGTLDYDITRYQPVLFAAESFAQMLEELSDSSSPTTKSVHGRSSTALIKPFLATNSSRMKRSATPRAAPGTHPSGLNVSNMTAVSSVRVADSDAS